MIAESRYVIAVPELARSAAFYADVLGFTIRESGDPGWLFFERDSCCIMAGECPDALPSVDTGDHSYFAYLVVQEIDAMHQSIVSAGATLIKDLRSEAWGMREFGIQTVDGHRIMFGMELSGGSQEQ
jgi:predicted enzyme related to lactoylglutathione lyase